MGHGEAWEPLAALGELIADLQPTLLVATGDMAHRGRRQELETAATLLRGLGLPFLAVPGNHDIPYTIPARFTRTFADWEHVFGETEPVHADDGVVVVGLNSVRAWRQQGGAVDDRAPGTRAGEAPGGRTRRSANGRAAPPSRSASVASGAQEAAEPPRRRPPQARRGRDRAGDRRDTCIRAGSRSGGSSRCSRKDPDEALVLATAPALGRPRPKRREEARGLNVYEAEPASLTVRTYAWDGQALLEVGRRTFART